MRALQRPNLPQHRLSLGEMRARQFGPRAGGFCDHLALLDIAASYQVTPEQVAIFRDAFFRVGQFGFALALILFGCANTATRPPMRCIQIARLNSRDNRTGWTKSPTLKRNSVTFPASRDTTSAFVTGASSPVSRNFKGRVVRFTSATCTGISTLRCDSTFLRPDREFKIERGADQRHEKYGKESRQALDVLKVIDF